MEIYVIEFNMSEDLERFIRNVRLLQEIGKDPREHIARAFEGVCVCVDTDTYAIYAAITDDGIGPYQDLADAINILPKSENEEELFKELNTRIGPSVLTWAQGQIEALIEVLDEE